MPKTRGMKKLAFGNNLDFPYFGFNSRHAEMDVLQKLNINYYKRNQQKLDLFVIRLTKTGDLAESTPCLHCLNAIILSKLNIKWIYYSTSNKTIVRTNLYNLYKRPHYITKGQLKHY
jgi:hypothetical protein